MLKRQEHAIEQVIRLRASVDDIYRRIDLGVYNAVRVQGVPARVVAERLNLTPSRIYQMIHSHEAWLNAELDK